MNWLDGFFIVILALFMLRGLNAGFLRGINGIIGFVVSVYVAVEFHSFLAGYLAKQWQWDEKIQEFIAGRLAQNGGTENLVDNFGMQVISEGLIGNAVSNIEIVTNAVLNAIAFTIIIIVVYTFLKIILSLASSVASKTFLSPLDKFGGLILGIAKGTLIIMVILMLTISLQPSLAFIFDSGGNGFLDHALKNSLITPYLIDLIYALNLPLPSFGTEIAGNFNTFLK